MAWSSKALKYSFLSLLGNCLESLSLLSDSAEQPVCLALCAQPGPSRGSLGALAVLHLPTGSRSATCPASQRASQPPFSTLREHLPHGPSSCSVPPASVCCLIPSQCCVFLTFVTEAPDGTSIFLICLCIGLPWWLRQ